VNVTLNQNYQQSFNVSFETAAKFMCLGTTVAFMMKLRED